MHSTQEKEMEAFASVSSDASFALVQIILTTTSVMPRTEKSLWKREREKEEEEEEEAIFHILINCRKDLLLREERERGEKRRRERERDSFAFLCAGNETCSNPV